MLRLENIKIREDLSDEEVVKEACKKYQINFKNIEYYNIFKKSIDARNKDDIFYNYTIDIQYSGKYGKKVKKVSKENYQLEINIKRKSEKRPVIVGAGPAGLFCALILVQNGIKPIIIEQGKKVEDRQKDVDEFLKIGKLNKNSNVQFGEGGAGTFSDGKLTTGVNNPLCRRVLEEFVNFGAPKQIMYINKPHIGTDNLINVISNMRNYIIEKGGEFLFENKLIDFEIQDEKIISAKYIEVSNSENINNIKLPETYDTKKLLNGELSREKINILNNLAIKEIETDSLVLAIGHSARDTFEKVYEKGLTMEKKNFSIGVRIEHKQSMINKSQYGTNSKLNLPPAEYKLAYHGKKRSCYTFCMCPGGTVMPSSSNPGEIVTNGMSKFARDGENANSAVLVSITPDDFKGNSVLEGIYFQKKLEEKAFVLGGSNYFAPIQKVGDFLENRKTKEIGEVKPTYKPGVTLSNLQEILPDYVVQTLKEGLLDFDKKIKGFANSDAILTGVETRSSSPVRIIRNEKGESNVKGIYPCGEGAGYAGGIMTAAIDGIKTAINILEKEY